MDLLRRVQLHVRPLLHAFGHIHEGAGEVSFDGTTLFANASTCTFHYQSLNPAVVVDLFFALPSALSNEPSDSSARNTTSRPVADAAPETPPQKVPKTVSRPIRADVVSSRVAEWSPIEVYAWLDRQEAATATNDNVAAEDSIIKDSGISIKSKTKNDSSASSSISLDRALQANRETTWQLPSGVASRLRGLNGPKLLALRPDVPALDGLRRDEKADCVRAIRHLEASEMN